MTALLVLLGYMLVGFLWALLSVRNARRKFNLAAMDETQRSVVVVTLAGIVLFWPLLLVAGVVGLLARVALRVAGQPKAKGAENQGEKVH